MPKIKPISDLQRNITEIVEECRSTQEPIYLAKNGNASLVVMDAEAFDRQFALQNEIRDREMRAYKAIMRGYEDMKAGRVRSREQAEKDIGELRREFKKAAEQKSAPNE